MFSLSGEDGKIGKGPVGSICKHFVNDPIFLSICSQLTCQLHGTSAGCSNGKGWKNPRLAVTSILSPKQLIRNSFALTTQAPRNNQTPCQEGACIIIALLLRTMCSMDTCSWPLISILCHGEDVACIPPGKMLTAV